MRTALQIPVLARLAPFAVLAALVAYLAIAFAGATGALLVATSALSGAGAWLLLRDEASAEAGTLARRVALGGLLLAPGLLVLVLSFRSGGYFPDGVAIGALLLLAAAVARCALASEPLAGLGPRVLVPAGGLALFAGWTWLSGRWSGSPGRALVEFDRVLLVLLALLLFGSIARTRSSLAIGVRGVAAAIVVIAGIGLVSRLLPDVLDAGQAYDTTRLSFPLDYWNALGSLCALGAVLCLHLGSSTLEPRAVRVLAAGALPALGCALLLTFSRGGVAVALIGLVVYAVVARPRGLITAAIAAGPLTFVVLAKAYDATLLASSTPTSPAAVAQGHELANVLVMCVAGAIVLRLLLLPVDGFLERLRLPERSRRPVVAGAWTAAITGTIVVALALGVPGEAADRWDQFAGQVNVGRTADTRDRLSSASNQGRVEHWKAALRGFQEHPVAGTGAGTFFITWDRHKTRGASATDAHSLYAETLSELGVVGLALLGLSLAAALTGLLPFRRGPDRALHAAVFAAFVVWVVHAGVDWIWEVPAVSLPVFALAGLALARKGPGAPRRRPGGIVLGAVGLALLALAIVPGLVFASQGRLDAGVDAFEAGECATALEDVRRSSDLLGVRPEPHELAGLCHAREGRYDRAEASLRAAVARDPENWVLRRSLATVLAAAGKEPGAELAAMRRIRPRSAGSPAVVAFERQLRSGRRQVLRDLAESRPPSGRW